MQLAPGTLVAGDLHLVRPLAQGAMGSIWVATDAGGVQYAVKFISSKLAERRPEALARFKREAEAAGRIRSLHVVRTYSYGRTSDGTPYIVMELLDGESLGARLERVGRLPPELTARIVHQVAQALEAAHSFGIVHRDIKPDNVFLTGPPQQPLVKVLDFGTVKQTRQRSDSVVTTTGVMVGTPQYMSPEQVLGSRDIDYRSDLWSLGVVAYRTLTGEEPFDGPHPHALCLAICRAVYRPASEVVADLPAGVDEWFARVLAPKPSNRFATAREMADELAALTWPAGPPPLDEELEITVTDLDDLPTHALLAEQLAAFDDVERAADEDGEARREPGPPPTDDDASQPAERAPSGQARDPSDDEPTRAYHRDALRAASGADRTSQPSMERSEARSRRSAGRSAVLVLLVTAALGAAFYWSGWLDAVLDRLDRFLITTGPGRTPSGEPAPSERQTAQPTHSPTVRTSSPTSDRDSAPEPDEPRQASPDSGDAPPGYVTIFCIPACHQIVSAGRALGPSPLVRAPLPPGEHELTLRRRGVPSKRITIRVVADQLTERRVAMP